MGMKIASNPVQKLCIDSTLGVCTFKSLVPALRLLFSNELVPLPMEHSVGYSIIRVLLYRHYKLLIPKLFYLQLRFYGENSNAPESFVCIIPESQTLVCFGRLTLLPSS